MARWLFRRTPGDSMPAWIRDRADYGWVRRLWTATPTWLTDEHRAAIRAKYREAKERGRVVDHIVPLDGKDVCGLHVPWNLQVITEADNRAKCCKWWPGGPEQHSLDIEHEPYQMALAMGA